MSNPIQPIQAVNAQTQTQPAAQPPKQTTAQSTVPQDKVTISESAKQALTDNTKQAAGGDKDHDGDTH
jgi:hypothetical protein